MATKPERNKATSPSRSKRGGKAAPKKQGGKSKAKASAKSRPKSTKRTRAKREPVRTPTEDTPAERQGLPARAERQGTRRIHSRELTPKESKARQERREKRRESEVASQTQHRKGLRKQGKGWGAARRARSGTRGR
jgi:hypothetical protein